MIKATELRIGNYVSNGGKQFDIEYWMLDTGMDGENVDYLPIILTSTLLDKCGFKNRKLSNFYFLENGNLIIEGYEADYNGLFIGNIKYLHQLQNLYFSLCGEELKVKL